MPPPETQYIFTMPDGRRFRGTLAEWATWSADLLQREPGSADLIEKVTFRKEGDRTGAGGTVKQNQTEQEYQAALDKARDATAGWRAQADALRAGHGFIRTKLTPEEEAKAREAERKRAEDFKTDMQGRLKSQNANIEVMKERLAILEREMKQWVEHDHPHGSKKASKKCPACRRLRAIIKNELGTERKSPYPPDSEEEATRLDMVMGEVLDAEGEEE